MDADGQQEDALWGELYPFESHYLDLTGDRLHYLDEGHGEAVVMLHGNPTWSFYYRNLVCGLRGERRVIVPDHMGCGRSDKPQSYSYRLSQHIENLEELLNVKLGLDRTALVVHDWGGPIGFGYAVRHPERITGIVVLNTAAFLLPNCPWRIRVCKLPLFGALAIRGLNAFARGALRMAVARPERLTDAVRQGYLAPYGSYKNRVANLRFVQDIPLGPRHPSWQTVAGMQKRLHLLAEKPVLVCWGDRDFCFTAPFLNTWRQYFPNALVHRFPDAGHYVLEDAHERIVPLVRDFLAQGTGQE